MNKVTPLDPSGGASEENNRKSKEEEDRKAQKTYLKKLNESEQVRFKGEAKRWEQEQEQAPNTGSTTCIAFVGWSERWRTDIYSANRTTSYSTGETARRCSGDTYRSAGS